MPFLLPALPAILGAAGSVGGALLNKGATNQQKKANQAQLDTEQDQRQLMDQYAKIQQQYGQDAANFYLQYMQKGSPFLQNLLSQHAGQIDKQYQDAGGQLQSRLAQSGFGSAPSGIAAASMGDLSRAEAGTQSESWLNDMMQNEQLKFQAGQGLNTTGNLFQPGQFALHRFQNPVATPSPWAQVPGAIATGIQNSLNPDKQQWSGGSVGGIFDPALGTISGIPGGGNAGGIWGGGGAANVPAPSIGGGAPVPQFPTWGLPGLPVGGGGG